VTDIKKSYLHKKLFPCPEQFFFAGSFLLVSGHYGGEHWLASFAVYALTQHQQ